MSDMTDAPIQSFGLIYWRNADGTLEASSATPQDTNGKTFISATEYQAGLDAITAAADAMDAAFRAEKAAKRAQLATLLAGKLGMSADDIEQLLA